MKDFTSKMRKFFATIVTVILLVSVFALPASAAGANATAGSKISEYVCDFEGNYSSSVNGSVEASDNGSALRFEVNSSATTHRFDIFNSEKGELKLNDGSVYAVKITYKVESISAHSESEMLTTINLVRHDGKSNTLVKVKAFPNATYNPGDTTGWVSATVVFKASVADSPDFDRLAINVVSPTCADNTTGMTGDNTYIWFDDIIVTECNSSTATIDFQSNGGSYCDVLMAQPGEAVTLPTPTRDLYDFAGWYTNADLTKKYDSDKMPSSLITKLYAAWEVSATSIKVEFTDAYDDSVVMLVGRTGDSLTLPSPTRRDFHFAGWYLDEALTTKCDYTVFPDSSTMLYAKWEVVPFFCGFENKEAYGTPNDSTFTKRCEILGTDVLRGQYSLSYNYWKGSQTEKPTQWRAAAGIMLINEHGEKFQATPGATYTISFSYKVNKVDVQNKGNKQGSFGVILSSTGGAWSNRAVMIQSYDKDMSFTYSKNDIEKGWQTGTLTFVAEPIGGNLDNSYLNIGIAGDAEIVVDDVCVYRVDDKFTYDGKCVINFDSQGGSYCETLRGEFDEAIVMPEEPVREGYRFMGWYTDPDGHELFTGDKFVNKYQKLYADWYLIPVETPKEEPVVDVVPPVEEESNNNMLIYIIIGVAVVIVAGAVVAVVAIKKKKNK